MEADRAEPGQTEPGQAEPGQTLIWFDLVLVLYLLNISESLKGKLTKLKLVLHQSWMFSVEVKLKLKHSPSLKTLQSLIQS